jgi:hypothetical protein
VTALHRGLKFNIVDSGSDIFQGISDWREQQGVGKARKLTVQADHWRNHVAKLSLDFLEANRTTKATSPRCSPDLAPDDFSLFGDMKRQLTGCSFENGDALLRAIHGMLDGFD